ncbi:hypothetical protein [Maridesulfovibrio sp.]|uniref:hypothetical protein n=1 Tax=Maridesulfovibrio sp. TaxID=2795000 RepID=UPI0029C9CDCD|nr:hypothetical protein [Maridesulfovibrio sp.]
MTLTRDSVDCDNNFDWATTWLLPLMDKIVDYINSLETTQTAATASVTAEVGAARSGAANLLAKIQDMDGVDADLLAMVQALAAGVGPVLYDPAATYSKNDVVVFDGGLYICIAADPVSGVAPPADTVWKNMLGWEKCPTPTLAGPISANEGTTQRISLGQSHDANARYWPMVSGGMLSELKQFPEDGGLYAGEWGFEWTMPTLDVDAVYSLLVYATKDGYARSNDISLAVTVIDMPVQNGPTVAFADTTAGYPGATVDADGVHAPAHSVGADNTNQIVSAQPEVTQTSDNLNIFNATASGFDTNEAVEAGDVVFTDTGQGTVLTVSENTGVYSVTLNEPLPSIPAVAVKKSNATLKVGAGVVGEYLGPEKSLALTGTPSTSSFDVEGGHANKIYTEGGLNNNLTVDGQDIKISSASESVAEGDTANLAQPFGDTSCVATYTFDDTLKSIDDLSPELPVAEFTIYVDGVFGKASLVESQSDYRIEGPIVDLDTGFCLSSWYDGSQSGGLKQQVFFERLSDNAIVQVGVQGYTTTPGGWVSTLDGTTDGQEWLWALQDGQPHHLVYNVEENDVVVYADKVEVFRKARPTGKHKLARVGTYNNIAQYFDQLRIFNRTLTTDEINALYVERGDITITTVTPEVELPAVPESVSIPDRCTLSPDSYSYALDGSDLKITGAEITLEDDPALKRLALAVSGADGLTFKSGKIYIKEKP